MHCMDTKLFFRNISIGLAALTVCRTSAQVVDSAQATESGLVINAPRVLVSNYQASFHFYHDLLGMKCVFGGAKANFAEFATGNETIQIFKRQMMPMCETKKSASDRLMIVFESNDVDKSYAALLAKGVKFAQKPTDMPTWSSRIALMRDPDGNLIEINGPLAAAVKH